MESWTAGSPPLARFSWGESHTPLTHKELVIQVRHAYTPHSFTTQSETHTHKATQTHTYNLCRATHMLMYQAHALHMFYMHIPHTLLAHGHIHTQLTTYFLNILSYTHAKIHSLHTVTNIHTHSPHTLSLTTHLYISFTHIYTL